MHWSRHRSPRRRSRPLLPGHGRRTRSVPSFDTTPLPTSRAPGRTRRRQRWDYQQTWRFDRAELTGRLYVGTAIALMALVLLSVLSTPTQPLQRAQEKQARMDAASDALSLDSLPVGEAATAPERIAGIAPHWIA